MGARCNSWRTAPSAIIRLMNVAPNASSDGLAIAEQAMREQERTFRLVYKRLQADRQIQERSEAAHTPVPPSLLTESANLLEVAWFCATLAEAAVRRDLRSFGELRAAVDQLVADATRITGVTDARLLAGTTGRRLAELGRRVHLRPDAPAGRDLDRPLQWSESLIALCPIDWLEQIARERDEPALGHRCRQALDGIRSFVLRNDGARSEARDAIGRAYADVRLSLNEVGVLLGMSPSDAIAFLENHGYICDASARQRTEQSVAEDLAAINADRLARAGAPRPDADLIRRDVIASQRIEGIDARLWLQSVE